MNDTLQPDDRATGAATSDQLEQCITRALAHAYRLGILHRRADSSVTVLVQCLRKLACAALAVDVKTLNAVPAHNLETARREANEVLSYFPEVK